MKQNKICFLLNYASHYRAPIFRLLDNELDCDFYFGNKSRTPIKKMNYILLSKYKKEFKRINLLGNFYWLKGSIRGVLWNYDIFVLTGEPYCLSNWLLLILSRIHNKRTFLWTHGWYGKEKGLSKIAKKFFYKLSEGLFLYGDYAKKLMIKEGFEESKLITIYNSLDYDKHLEIRKTLKNTDVYKKHFKNDYPNLIYVGRIQSIKRIDLVLEAIKLLKKKGVIINFTIVGKDIDNVALKNIVMKMNIENQVWFYGPSYDEIKLGELFYNALVCVSPGHIGLTAIHSLSFGTPVITHNNFPYQSPEFEAIIEGETGSFFKENDALHLTEVITQYINMDAVKTNTMKDACFKTIDEKYNPYCQLEKISDILNT